MLKGFVDKVRKNNNGAALVMVIVVISFVSITATIMLYMSAMNFYMKTTDMKTKKSFYSGEKAMEEIRADLMVAATSAFDKAYPKVLVNYSSSDPDSMQAALNKEFVTEFEKVWKYKVLSDADATNLPDADEVKEYLVDSVVDSSYSSGISVTAEALSSKTFFKDESKGIVTIKRVTVVYLTSENYMTKISTDFIVKAPQIAFDLSSTDDDPIKLADCVIYSDWVKE